MSAPIPGELIAAPRTTAIATPEDKQDGSLLLFDDPRSLSPKKGSGFTREKRS